MADESTSNVAALAANRDRPFSRLIFGPRDDDWHLEEEPLHAVALACQLSGSLVECNSYDVTALSPAAIDLFTHPPFGGMQLPDSSTIYPGEPIFLLQDQRQRGLPKALTDIAALHGKSRGSKQLVRLRLPRIWTRELEAWFTSVGFYVSLVPRLRWQLADDHDGPDETTSEMFSALLASPEVGSHHVSLFMRSPQEARWTMATSVATVRGTLKRFLDLTCLYKSRSATELYVRVESDLPVSARWYETIWTTPELERRRFIVHVGDEFTVRGHVVLASQPLGR